MLALNGPILYFLGAERTFFHYAFLPKLYKPLGPGLDAVEVVKTENQAASLQAIPFL
jgi:hypothetical protein